MDKTANLKLNKPKTTDFVSETVEKVFGENFDIIDDEISDAQSRITDISNDLDDKADNDHTHSDLAPKASPAFTGKPTAPTASKGTSTTQLATTKFVQDAIDGIVIPEDTSALAHSHPNKTVLDGISADDVSGWRGHLSDTSNPHNVKFSQTVQRLGSNADLDDIDDGFYIASDRVDSLPAFSNEDSPGVVLQTSHGSAKIQVAFAMSEQYWRIYRRRYSNNVWTAWEHQNASPVFTGTPAAPTAASGTNTTQIATTAFVAAAIAAINITKEAVGLGNVPNVATNDQTPTYTAASTLATLVSSEKLSVSMGKIMLAMRYAISGTGLLEGLKILRILETIPDFV